MVEESVVVSAPHGQIRGIRDDRGEVFRGIDYAEPPVGPLRLRASRLRRTDRRRQVDATRFGPAAPQVAPFYLSDVTDFAEDCLTLNVWRAIGPSDPRPVLVWVHGGGFKAGATSGTIHDSRALAETGMIVVTVNYRVGALGFGTFAHRGGRLAEATNLGLGDVISALQWIQLNIAAFGGDPDRVCVAGQSAGAFLAGALLAAPSARGLFARLVPMSGGPYKIINREAAQEMGDEMLQAVGISADAPVDTDHLEAIPAAAWVAAADRVTAGDVGDRNAVRIRGLGVVDDHHFTAGLLSGHPMRLPHPTGVDLLLTATAQESAFWTRLGPSHFRPCPNESAVQQDLVGWGIPAERARIISERYVAHSGSADLARQDLLTDWIFHVPQARAARHAARFGARAWLAVIDVPDLDRTGHFDDTPHLFGTATDPTPAQLRFGGGYRAVVADFAASGHLDWPRVTTRTAPVQFLGTQRRLGDLDELCRLWDGIERP